MSTIPVIARTTPRTDIHVIGSFKINTPAIAETTVENAPKMA